jgi:DNA-binding beta-propeller fold protein YncE
LNGPVAVSANGTHVWVTNAIINSVTEFDASTGRLVQVLSAARYGFNDPNAVSSDGTHVWVTNLAAGVKAQRTQHFDLGGSVTEVNASTGGLVRVLTAARYGLNAPMGVSSDRTHVWVANFDGNSVTEINASSGALVQVRAAPRYGFALPAGVSSDGSDVWVPNGDQSLSGFPTS